MDTIIWLLSVALGLFLVGAYVIRCWRGHRTFELSILVNVMIASSGVVGGLALIASVFVTSLRANLASLSLYLVIGGLAVAAVSVRSLYRDVFAHKHSQPPTAVGEAPDTGCVPGQNAEASMKGAELAGGAAGSASPAAGPPTDARPGGR